MTHQDCELATQQLRAQWLLVRVDVEDALFDSCVLRLEKQNMMSENRIMCMQVMRLHNL